MSDPRELAFSAIKNSLSQRGFLTIPAADNLSAADIPFVNMLCLTAVRNLTGIQLILKDFLRKKLPPKARDAWYLLLLGTTELLYMRTPDYAVINSYVNLAKKLTDRYVANMVNAVLRNISRQKEELRANEYPFFPDNFRTILKQDYAPETIKKIEQAARSEPPLTISVKKDTADWAQRLNGTHIAGNSLKIDNAGQITALDGYADGAWWVQDFAASLAVTALSPLSGMRVLDLCAAPSGKTAQLLSAGANVTSLDSSAERLKTLRENISRLQLPMPEIINDDAARFLQNYNGPRFDAIILDAPCSATGIFRRHPELIHFKDKNDTAKQAALQKKILEQISCALKPDGILIYCVCSIAKCEGERQIRRFLETHPDFKAVPITEKDLHPRPGISLRELITKEGFVRTLPYMLSAVGGIDSFFIAKLHKEK